MTTWAEVLNNVVGAYELLGTEHPELAGAEVQAGAEVKFLVNVDPIGPVTVSITVPVPLAPPTGTITVSFRDVAATDIPVGPAGLTPVRATPVRATPGASH